MATILEPLPIVVMGVVVVLIMLAVLLPVNQLDTWVCRGVGQLAVSLASR
jgi:general secretion pathway protein F